MWDLTCNFCISNLDPSLLRFPVLSLTSNHAWPADLLAGIFSYLFICQLHRLVLCCWVWCSYSYTELLLDTYQGLWIWLIYWKSSSADIWVCQHQKGLIWQLQLWLQLVWRASPSNSSKPQHHLQQSLTVFYWSCRASSQISKMQLWLQNQQRMGMFVKYQLCCCCDVYYHSFLLEKFGWECTRQTNKTRRWYKNTLFFTGKVQKKMQAASKRLFPSRQLMNTDHMVVSRFDAKINTLVCTLGTWTNILVWNVPTFGNWMT